MELMQLAQMKQLEAKHEREMKEMNTRQAKISVETSKEVIFHQTTGHIFCITEWGRSSFITFVCIQIANDKTLKTKQEKERRLKEKQQNNTKKFLDERKTATIKQGKEREKLKIKHDKQLEMLSHDIQKMIDMYKNEELEYDMSSKSEFFA